MSNGYELIIIDKRIEYIRDAYIQSEVALVKTGCFTLSEIKYMMEPVMFKLNELAKEKQRLNEISKKEIKGSYGISTMEEQQEVTSIKYSAEEEFRGKYETI